MHGPFTWGKDAHDAMHNAVVLEEVAKMAYRTLTLNANIGPMDRALLDKHFKEAWSKRLLWAVDGLF